MDVLVHPRLPAPLRSQPKPESIMLFRNDETKEEREAREDIFGSRLSVPAGEAPAMEVDRFIPPEQLLSIREPREIPQQALAPIQPSRIQPAAAAAAHVKMFGARTSPGISLPNPAEPSLDVPAASSTPAAPPTESHRGTLSTPFIRTVSAPAVPAVPASGGPISPTTIPAVWRGTAADEDGNEGEDEEMPEINIESDSE